MARALAVRAARYGEAHVPNGAFCDCSSLTALTIVSDHAEPRVLTREQPFDTAEVELSVR